MARRVPERKSPPKERPVAAGAARRAQQEHRPPMAAVKPNQLTLDYRSGDAVPTWVREVIDTHFAIEAEDARHAGSLGFMARALVIATMPYKDPRTDVFKRQNGDFRLRIVAGYEGGIPYGIYPRLLMSWVSTEAVRRQSPEIQLGDTLRAFLRDVMDLRSSGGGARGSGSRVAEQIKRLFGSLITAHYTGGQQQRGFVLRNVLIAENLQLNDAELIGLWTPQHAHEAGRWQSQVRLSNGFFRECIDNPVPIDLRAYKALRGSPLAMDVYTWLTYRMSYTQRRSRPIRWEPLMMQFGCDYGSETNQAVRDFKKAFLKALKLVLAVYPQARVEVGDAGVVLLPSRPHILPPPVQHTLF